MGVWFHKTSLAPPRFIEVPVPSEESERVRSVDFAYFYDLSIRFWSCFDSVVFFVFLFYLELFRQRGIFCFSIRFWSCFDSVVFFVFLLDFGVV